MANTIFSSEGALLFIMVATVALGFWLQRFKVFKTLGPALTVIMGIVMSNLRIVPTSSPTYDAISSYCVPLSVSICLLSLDLKQMRKLSKEPIIALASAIFSVCVAALVFGVLFANKIDEGWKVAGMFVGTYTGGSSNLTAIAVGLDASKNTIASANAADYVVGIPTLGGNDTIAPAVTKGNTTLLDWLNEEIKALGEEKFFHADYEATLADTYGLDYEDELVVEGGVTAG